MNPLKRQDGVAVIMAILIVALAALLATALLWEQSLWLRQIESQRDLTQAQTFAQAGTRLAAAVVNISARNETDIQQAWAQPIPPLPVEGGKASGLLQDEQGLFNLNNLVVHGQTDPIQKRKFARLLELLAISPDAANALADWIDDDNTVQNPGGAEDAYYLALPHAYRAANRMLTDIDELAQVRGFDRAAVERLKPCVCALPEATTVNVNTAPPEVLVAMVKNLTLPEARSLVAQRDAHPFASVSDFHSALPRIELSIDDSKFSVSSKFFLASVTSQFGRATATVQTLLERDNTLWPHVVWQKSL